MSSCAVWKVLNVSFQLSRAETQPVMEVWPVTLGQPLPTVPVPLFPGDPDVPLDLQQALTHVYDLCRYDLAVDYAAPPEVPLAPGELASAAERLRAQRGGA